MMFEAFKSQAGLGKDYNNQKPMVRMFWPYSFIDVFGSEKSHDKMC